MGIIFIDNTIQTTNAKLNIQKRNYTIDLLKGFCAILAVFIHAKFPDDVGEFIVAFSGMAVLVFFLTSGYFSAKSDRKKLKRSICHILSLICFAYIISFVRICVQDGFSFFALINQITDIIFSLKNLVLFFVFNVTKISGVSWFLFALLYCYIFNLIFYNLL